MPYNTGVLLDAGVEFVTHIDEVVGILSPILSDFFGREIESHTWSYESRSLPVFTLPNNMYCALPYNSEQRICFRLSNEKGGLVSSYWTTSVSTYGFVNDLSRPINYHVAIGENGKTMSIGVGTPKIGEPCFTVTFAKVGESYIYIQHGVTDKRSNAGSDPAFNIRDVYHKSSTDFKIMSSKASGGYYSDSKLVLAPAVDPWTGDVISDLYLSILRPSDTRSVRNLISVNGRQFISGVVNDGGGDAYIKAMPTFVKI